MADLVLIGGTGTAAFVAGFVLASVATAAKTSELERRLRMALRTVRGIARDDSGPAGDLAMHALGTDLELTTSLSRKVSTDALD